MKRMIIALGTSGMIVADRYDSRTRMAKWFNLGANPCGMRLVLRLTKMGAGLKRSTNSLLSGIQAAIHYFLEGPGQRGTLI